MSRVPKFVVFSLAVAMTSVGVGAIYYGVRKHQRHAVADMILGSQGMASSGSRVEGTAAIEVSKRREIYEKAILAAEKIAELDEKKRNDGVTPIEEYEAYLKEALASSIHRIALGNALTEGDVLKIVREGSANGW